MGFSLGSLLDHWAGDSYQLLTTPTTIGPENSGNESHPVGSFWGRGNGEARGRKVEMGVL